MKRLLWFAGLALIFLLAFSVAAGAEPSFVWPVRGEVITSFRVTDNQYEGGQHRGIDISASVGDEVASAAEGTVTYAARNPRGGYMITIDHPSGLSTTYLGLGEKEVGRGQAVTAGQPIGKIGSEGDSSSNSPHLHLGVYETASRSNKVYLNPLVYLPPLATEPELASQPSVSPVAQGDAPSPPVLETAVTLPEEAAITQPLLGETPGPSTFGSTEEPAITQPSFGDMFELVTLEPAEAPASSAPEAIELPQSREFLPETVESVQLAESLPEIVEPLQPVDSFPKLVEPPQINETLLGMTESFQPSAETFKTPQTSEISLGVAELPLLTQSSVIPEEQQVGSEIVDCASQLAKSTKSNSSVVLVSHSSCPKQGRAHVYRQGKSRPACHPASGGGAMAGRLLSHHRLAIQPRDNKKKHLTHSSRERVLQPAGRRLPESVTQSFPAWQMVLVAILLAVSLASWKWHLPPVVAFRH